MHIRIEKSVLEPIVLQLQPFIDKKDASQITSHILLECHDGYLRAKATDYDMGLSITAHALEILAPGVMTVNGKKILDIIRILKDETLELTTHQEMLHITQNRSLFKLPMFNGISYPPFPELGNPIDIEGKVLLEALKKITPSADTNNPKFELNGALIDVQEEHITCVATDTKRLSMVRFGAQHPHVASLIVPKKAMIEIQKIFTESFTLYSNETYLMFQSESFHLFTKLINGRYPDYLAVLPKKTQYTLSLPKAPLIAAIRQITSISNEIKITFDTDLITLESLSDENIEAKTQLEITLALDTSLSLGLNSRHILDFLAQVESSNFTLSIESPQRPILLSDGTFETIIMPIVL